MSSKNERKSKATAGSILMRSAGILLALTALTVWGTSFLFAKYTAGGNGGDGARVAKFDVNATMPSQTVTVDVCEGGAGSFVVKLTNKSEVAVRAGLTLDFTTLNTTAFGTADAPQKIVSTVNVKFSDDTGNGTDITVGDDNKAVIDKTFDMAAAGSTADGIAETVTFTLTIPALVSANDNAALLAITKNMTGLSGTTDAMPFDVIATFVQID